MTGERIAGLRELSGGVRWQNPKDVVWNEARGGQALYDGQSVMTLSDSTARLVFDTSTELDIGSKTLLQIQAKKSGNEHPLLLSLSRGTFRATTKRPIEIAAGEFTVQVDSGTRFEVENVAAEKSRSGHAALRLKVEEGGAHSGKTTVTRDQTIEIPILTKDEAASAPTVAPVIVETETVRASPTPSPEPSPTPRAHALPPPNVQAPVFRRHSPRPSSSSEKSGASFFDLFFPSASAAEETDGEWDIELRWDAVPNAKAYRIEVARTRNFGSRIAEDSASEPHWTLPYRKGMENSRGRIFYRIASVDEHGKVGKFSEPKIFTVPMEILHPVVQAPPKPEPAHAILITKIETVPTVASATVYWTLRPAAEMTSLTETSHYTQLRKVDTGSAYLHEALAISHAAPGLLLAASLRTNHFKSEGAALPKTRSYRAALTAERATSVFGGHFFVGGALVYEDHFVKTGADSLGLDRAFSAGPSVTLAYPLWSLALRFPLTGAFGKGALGGPYGPTLHLERDWEITPSIRVSLSGEGSYHLWDSDIGPSSAVTEWSIGLGPKVILR